MYLLGRRGGFRSQNELWKFVEKGLVEFDVPAPGEWERMRDVMARYEDLPMDVADASLVTAAERLGTGLVFTIDSHFRAYRIRGTGTFDVVP
jgi:predicted nucleic acid-binding protein